MSHSRFRLKLASEWAMNFICGNLLSHLDRNFGRLYSLVHFRISSLQWRFSLHFCFFSFYGSPILYALISYTLQVESISILSRSVCWSTRDHTKHGTGIRISPHGFSAEESLFLSPLIPNAFTALLIH